MAIRYEDLLRQFTDLIEAEAAAGPDDPPGPLPISIAQLCYFSYDEPISQIAWDVSDRGKTYPPITDHGFYWEVTWGPALDPLKGNLAYVAGLFFRRKEEPEVLVAVAVITRGTIFGSAEETLEDVWEDLAAAGQSHLPWMIGNSDIWVADGSLDTLSRIQGLTAWSRGGEVDLLQYLGSLPNYQGHYPAIVVAGHSLGGCASTLIAPWLMEELPKERTKWLVPITLAAPTAGNQAFVDYFNSRCGKYHGYVNTLDCVPLAWWNLDGMVDIYQPDFSSLPVDPLLGVAALGLEDVQSPYAQIPVKFGKHLPGAIIPISNGDYWTSFPDEVLAQHACANYLLMMNVYPIYAHTEGAPRQQRLEPSQAKTD